MPAMSRMRMGLPIDRLVIATNVNDILARTLATGAYEPREVIPTTSPSMDIQVASNFERILFDAGGRDAKAVRAMMDSLAQSRRFALSGRSLSALRAIFAANRADEQETAAAIRTMLRETGHFIDPHTAVGVAVAEKEARDRSVPMVVLSTAHAAKFPDAVQAACGKRPPLPDWLGDLHDRPERFATLARRSGRGRAPYSVLEPRRPRRSCRMSVEVTRLPSGLTVVTDAMPHLESASLGVWVGSGSRDERPDEHGISHLLEHMAFKGTSRRTARQIAEEVEAVGGDLNAATSVETTSYYARVLRADVPLAIDVLSDILSDPAFDPEELQREQNVIVQEIGAAEDAPDDLVFDKLQETAFPEPAARALDPRHPRHRALVRPPASSRAYLSAQLSRARHGGGGGGRGRPCRAARQVERRFCQFSGPARAGAGARRALSAAPISRRASSSRCTWRWRCTGCRSAIPTCSACRSSPACSAAECRRGCSRRCARSAGSATRSTPSTRPIRTPGCSASMPAPTLPTCPELMRVVVGEITNAAETITEAEVARAKAQMKAGLLMALESSGARIEQLARQMFAWGRPIALPELVAKIEAVTVESARAAGRALIARGRPAIAALGPGPGLKAPPRSQKVSPAGRRSS